MRGNITSAEIITSFNTSMLSSPATDSVHDYFEKGEGESVQKILTLTGNNATVSQNIFQLTGTVEVLQLTGTITTNAPSNMTSVSFELYDSNAAIAITSAGGSTLSALPVGTYIYKNAASNAAVQVNTAASGSFSEPGSGRAFAPFVVTQKSGANTYIRLTYTTNADIRTTVMTFNCRYRPRYSAASYGTLVVV